MFDLATELKKVAFRNTRYSYKAPRNEMEIDDAIEDGEIFYARELLKKCFHWTEEEIQAKVKSEGK